MPGRQYPDNIIDIVLHIMEIVYTPSVVMLKYQIFLHTMLI